MLKNTFAMLTLAAMTASCVGAETPEQLIRKNIEPRLRDGMKIETIRLMPFGLYEINAGGDLIYTDKNGEYLFIGDVINNKTQRNVTKDRVEELSKIQFKDLPFDLALKTVKGDGKRQLALFEDPNCGYCKRFRQTVLKDVDNVTIYTFMLDILSEDSIVKSRNIWCSPDRNKAWDDWMVNGKPAPAAPAECTSTPHDKISALGRKLHISGTPAIYFADGSRIPGMVDLKTLESKFASVKAQ
jgi:thiol:disulfide interchange protein DsbC